MRQTNLQTDGQTDRHNRTIYRTSRDGEGEKKRETSLAGAAKIDSNQMINLKLRKGTNSKEKLAIGILG